MREDTLRKLVSLFFRYLWLIFGVLLCGNLFNLFLTTTTIMETSTREKIVSLSDELASTVSNSYKLLEGMQGLPGMDNTSIPVADRAWLLRPFAKAFDVWMIGVVDPDGSIAGTLSYGSTIVERDYIPRIVASKQKEMTNAFPSGETGEMNYTQLVPIIRNNEVVSIVFVSTLLSDLKKKLARSNAEVEGHYYIVDSSLTIGVHPDKNLEMRNFEELTKNEIILGSANLETILTDFKSGKENAFYSICQNTIYYSAYTHVPGTSWQLGYRVHLFKVFATALSGFAVQVLLYALVLAVLMFVWHRYMQQVLAPVDSILKQVIDLNRIVHNSDTCSNEDAASLLHISRQGLHDELTSLPTRMLFRQMLNERMHKLDTSSLCAVYYLDMDNLKNINDTLGHDYGDMALRAFGQVVREVAEKYAGLCARYGGDEFILYVENLESESVAKSVAAELQKKLNGCVGIEGNQLNYYASIGVALYPLHAMQIDVVIQLADIALYQVKQNGKNGFALYSNALNAV